MPCTSASYKNKRDGYTAKRTVKRAYKANTALYLCGACDRYHVRVDVGRYPVSLSWQTLLECLAQGMSIEEMSAHTHLAPRSVEWAIEEMKNRFYALNRVNLVAIAIALGIVDPNKFVPSIEEATHEPSAHV